MIILSNIFGPSLRCNF